MEYPSVEALMKQIRDWAEEEDYDAIIEVLPELKTPGQYYEAVLCVAYAYLNQGFTMMRKSGYVKWKTKDVRVVFGITGWLLR